MIEVRKILFVVPLGVVLAMASPLAQDQGDQVIRVSLETDRPETDRNVQVTLPVTEQPAETGLKQNDQSGLQFVASLYNSLRNAKSGEDIFFSPFSISSALSMLRVGATGDTAAQMAKVMGAPESIQNANDAYRKMLTALKTESNVTLDFANKVFAHSGKDFIVKENFNQTLRQYYDSAIETMDFSGNPEGSRKSINSWVEDVTRDKIKDLLPTGSISPATKMVLANAVYFKGDWAEKFLESATFPQNFYRSEKVSIEVPMMHITETFDYKETPDAQIVTLPYQGEDIVMTLVVPKEKFGLSAIEDKLSSSKISDYLWGPRRRSSVQLTMPKFKIESSFQLKEYLTKLGMVDMFDQDKAQFNGISDSPLYVDEGFHKAFVEVNEKGTEAAAATGLVIVATSLILPDVEVNADRPFVFFIHHPKAKTVLFSGRVSKLQNSL